MKELGYQEKYIQYLVETASKYLDDEYREQSTIIFKAPTGSGKTYMVSQALTNIVKENPKIELAFIWISLRGLHEQSLNNLSKYFEGERLLKCLRHHDITNNTIGQNEIIFINWESINKKKLVVFCG
jgi:type III restriction enzyme